MEISSSNPEQTQPETSLANPWFAVTLGLLGLMFGYGVALFEAPPAAAIAPPQIVQAGNPVPNPSPNPIPPLPVARRGAGCGIN